MIKHYIEIQISIAWVWETKLKKYYLVFKIIDSEIELDLDQLIHNAIYDLIRNKIYSQLV